MFTVANMLFFVCQEDIIHIYKYIYIYILTSSNLVENSDRFLDEGAGRSRLPWLQELVTLATCISLLGSKNTVFVLFAAQLPPGGG